ncbi:hypothetical protein EMCRGX_G006281 [Ephydatia muelleri]
MASDLTKNEFWLKKMTARFHAMNSKKDGVLTKADFDILIENIIKFGKLNDAQAERCRKQMATLLPLFGDETFKITQEGFNDAAAKSSEGNYLVLLGNQNFDIIDTDADGIISYNEWVVYFESIGIDVKHARPCFDALNTNKDGKLTRSEFLDATVNFVRSTDESHPSRFLFGLI